MDFRRCLRLYRTQAQLSQEQLALACGWSGQSRIANYEASPDKKNAREPTLGEISVIARVLGVTEAQLLGLTDNSLTLSSEEHQLLADYRAAPGVGKEALARCAKAFAQITAT